MNETDNARNQRFLIGLTASVIFHIIFFLIFQYFVNFTTEKTEEFRSAITVTLQPEKPNTGAIKKEGIVKNLSKKVPKSKTKITNKPKLKKITTSEQISKKSTVEKKSFQSTSSKPVIISNQKNIKVETGKGGFTRPSSSEVATNLKQGEVRSVSPEKGKVPVIPQKVKEKPLPFKPGVKIEESPLAFNVGQLEGKEEANKSTELQPGVKKNEASEVNQPVESSSVIKWEKGIKNRKVISMGPKPKIPAWVKKEGLKLKVSLEFEVNPDGYVTDVKVFKSSGYSDVDASVIESVRKILFEPIKSNKKSIARITYIIEPK